VTEAGARDGPAAERTFVVASYNIHRGIGMDGRRDLGRIAQVIREIGAEILGLQEVDSGRGGKSRFAQLEELADLSGYHVTPGPTILRDDRRFGNLLLTGERVRETRRLDLSLPGREPRGAIDADLDIDGMPLRVIVTHLGLWPGERRVQVRRLLDVLKEERDRLTVILGDINEWIPGSRPLRWMNRVLGRSPAPRTFPSVFPLLALDRIWVWPRRALLAVRAHRTPLARVASDHLPVKAVVAAIPVVTERIPEVEAEAERERAFPSVRAKIRSAVDVPGIRNGDTPPLHSQ
jgi:endonuclease/exonuclease/phosphatase family metal-dependent hydrolase